MNSRTLHIFRNHILFFLTITATLLSACGGEPVEQVNSPQQGNLWPNAEYPIGTEQEIRGEESSTRNNLVTPISGDFSVNNNGEATYAIPVDVPPGINGFSPEITLNYSSNASKSFHNYLGDGWSIGGLLEISLCKAIKSKDGFTASISHTNGDKTRFCLNGDPLVFVSDSATSYGANGSEYVLEKRNNIKVKAFGGEVGQPDYFQIKDGQGKIFTLGATPGSKILTPSNQPETNNVPAGFTYAWRINESQDRFGNTITYEYGTEQGTTLSFIWYRGYLSGENSVRIYFKWEYNGEHSALDFWAPDSGQLLGQTSDQAKLSVDTDAALMYSGGSRIFGNNYRLESITTSVGSEYHGKYKLEYEDANITNFKRANFNPLRKIHKCYGAESPSNCSSPIELEYIYQNENLNPNAVCGKEYENKEFDQLHGIPRVEGPINFSHPLTNQYPYLTGNYYSQVVGDFNNDELMDLALVYTYKDGNKSRIDIDVAKSRGDGTFDQLGSRYTSEIGPPLYNNRLSGDINNDGYDDIIIVNSNSNTGINVYAIINNGDGTFATPAHYNTPKDVFHSPSIIRDTTHTMLLGDFNGDTHLDIAVVGHGYPSGDDDMLWMTARGFEIYLVPGDGDGGFNTAFGQRYRDYKELQFAHTLDTSFLTGDFNGDSITDIAIFKSGSISYGVPLLTRKENTAIYTALGQENGLFHLPPEEEIYEGHAFDGLIGKRFSAVGDINGDGLDDILAWVRWADGDVMMSHFSRGDGTFKLEKDFVMRARSFGLPVGDIENMPDLPEFPVCGGFFIDNGIAGDFNADGLLDLRFTREFYLSKGNGKFLKQSGLLSETLERDFYPTWGNVGSDGTMYLSSDPYYSNYTFDVNNDGHVDSVTAVTRPDGFKVLSQLSLPPLAQKKLRKIKDGFGREIDITYGKIGITEHYTPEGNNTYPIKDIRKGPFIVESVAHSDGVGGTYEKEYFYKDLEVNIESKKYRGFSSILVTDSRNDITNEQIFYRSHPLSGKVKEQITKLNQTTIERKSYDISAENHTSFDGIQEHTYYILKTENLRISEYDDLGIEIYSKTVSNYDFDELGLPREIREESSDGYHQTLILDRQNNFSWSTYEVGKLNSTVQMFDSSSDYVNPTGSSRRRETGYSYYPNGALKSVTVEPNDPNLFLRQQYSYDSFGNPFSITQSGHSNAKHPIETRTQTTEYILGSGGQYSTPSAEFEIRVKNALNQTSSYYMSTLTGKLLRYTDENNLTTHFKYGNAQGGPFNVGSLVARIEPQGATTNYIFSECDIHCPSEAVYSIHIRSSIQEFSETYLDIFNRPVRVRTNGFDGRPVYQDIKYDSSGRTRYISEQYNPGQGEHLATSYEYDDLGRVQSINSPLNGIENYEYRGLNGQGKEIIKTQRREGILGVDEIVTRFHSDHLNNIYEIIDAHNEHSRYLFNSIGEPVGAYDAQNRRTNFQRDQRGRVIKHSNFATTNNFEYDALGLLRAHSDIRTRSTDKLTEIEYDKLNRPIKRKKLEGEDVWVYDIGHKAVGQLTTEISADGNSITYEYDDYGRPYQDTTSIDGSYYSYKYGYDNQNRLNTLTYPGNYTINYNYNEMGYLQSVSDAELIIWEIIEKNSKDELKQVLLGNQLSTSYEYHPSNGRIHRISTTSLSETSTPVQNYSFTFDSIGNLNRRTDRQNYLEEVFTYDQLNRLKRITQQRETAVEIDYDSVGNITYKSDYALEYHYSETSQRVGMLGAITDLQGNRIEVKNNSNGSITSYGDKRISYTSYDMPRYIVGPNRITGLNYDAGNNVIKTFDSYNGSITETINIESHIAHKSTYQEIGSYNATVPSVQNYQINVNGVPIAIRKRVDNDSSLVYLHYDHQGSPTQITNQDGEVIESLSFDAFGKRRNPDGSPIDTIIFGQNTNIGFTGHQQLDVVGLVHMKSRLYDPSMGRFTGTDPVVSSMSNPQALNPFSYALNNPLTHIDPTGKAPIGGHGISSVIERAQTEKHSQIKYSNQKNYTNLGSQAWANNGTRSAGFSGAGSFGNFSDMVSGYNSKNSSLPEIMVYGSSIDGSSINPGDIYSTQPRQNLLDEIRLNPNWGARAQGNSRSYVPQKASDFGPQFLAAIPIAIGMSASDGPVPAGEIAGGSLLTTAYLADQAVKIHITYSATNAKGQMYFGRASGYGDPHAILARRWASHHMKIFGFSDPVLDEFAPGISGKTAIRGREQQLINRAGGVGSPKVGNRIRGVSKLNPAGQVYHNASSALFGEIAPYDGYFDIYRKRIK